MKQIQFYKMVASGNDFVVVDNRRKAISVPSRFAREMCRVHTGVGADGVLLVENSRKAGYKVRIFNPDGSEAEACGNGFRCVAWLAHERLGFSKKHGFESLSGLIDAEVKRRSVRVRLMDPEELKEGEALKVRGRKLRYSFIRVGVPHVVIFVEGLAKIPVFEMGREIRYQKRFAPAGTNVNFVEIQGPQSIAVRTYERGVEQNTLACGTGSTAAAIVSALRGHTRPPVRVATEGGEILTVDFSKNGNRVQKVYLEGEAKLVFEGVMPVIADRRR